MPHLYADQHKESEEIQQLLHLSMLEGLVTDGRLLNGDEWAASWENITHHSMLRTAESGTATVMQKVRTAAMTQVVNVRMGATQEPVYGAVSLAHTLFSSRHISVLPRAAAHTQFHTPRLPGAHGSRRRRGQISRVPRCLCQDAASQSHTTHSALRCRARRLPRRAH